MGPMRGVILIIFGILAVYRGWTLHAGLQALLAYALGVVSLAIGGWRVSRRTARRRL
jgi:hypothetical protein